jgi:hypothetical protein
MDSANMILQVVYENKEGMFPLEIAEAVSKRFNTQMSTREVEQTVKKNHKLFIVDNGKIKCPVND